MKSTPPVRRRWPRVLAWSVLTVFVGLPLLFAAVFLGIQEATERQWLGKAPHHDAIDARLKTPHRLALLDVGRDSLQARLQLIESARESIELEFFIYNIDTASRLVTQALARKAAQGVKVRILVDFALPVFQLGPQVAQGLSEAGIEVRYYNTAGVERFFATHHRTHRKLLVVDRQQAILGGRNIANEYFDLSPSYNFLDSDVLVEGPIVGSIADSFDLYWSSEWVTAPTAFAGEAGAGFVGLLDALPTDEAARLAWATQGGWQPRWHACNDVHFVTDYPGSGVERRKVFLEIARLAQEAHKGIDVESPYLILRADGVNLLQQVLDRGVQLRILTNSLYSTDAFYTVSSLARALDRLQQPGLEVWAYNGEASAQDPQPASKRWGVHSKRAVFDDTISLIGTYNIDPRSANLNSELILVCRDSASLATEMRRDIRARMAQARPVVGTAQPGGYEALVEGADAASVRRMWLVSPLANWLDFLM